jgi:hypothetical protein
MRFKVRFFPQTGPLCTEITVKQSAEKKEKKDKKKKEKFTSSSS